MSVAQDDATRAVARSLSYEADQALRAGDDTSADEKFDKAFSLVAVPVLGLHSARSRVRLGKLVEAAERYRQVIRIDASALGKAGPSVNIPLQRSAQADAASELELLLPRIPRLVIEVEGGNVSALEVELDATALSSMLIGESYPVNPGLHHLLASLGDQHIELDLELVEGERRSVLLRFEPTSAAGLLPPAAPTAAAVRTPPSTDSFSPPRLQRTFGWSLLSLGGAVAAFGGASYVYGASERSAIERRHYEGKLSCAPEARGPCDRYNSWRRVPPVAYVAGSVLAGAGIFLLIWPWRTDHAEVTLALSSGFGRLEGEGASAQVVATLRTFDVPFLPF